mgnify:CR=1 FL=1
MDNNLRTYLNKKISVLPEWLSEHLYRTAKLAIEFAEHYKEFGTTLEFVTDKSQEGSQFCKGFGGLLQIPSNCTKSNRT